MASPVALIPELAGHIIAAGGKRLRPVIALLSARSLDYRGDRHVDLAAIVELIHTATLLHDDVVDESDLRRGKEAARVIWGNQASVLVGDYLLGQAFRMMVETGSLESLRILSNAALNIPGVRFKAVCDIWPYNLTRSSRLLQKFNHEAKPYEDYKELLATEKELDAVLAEADLLLIAPATANCLAKLAHGIADDALTCIALALNPKARLLLAPAMNGKMWAHPATQANVRKLRERGAQFVGPADGMLACGYEGLGRLSEVEAIVTAALKMVKP